MRRSIAVVLFIALLGCVGPDGTPATSHPSWGAALERADRYGLLDPDCRDDGVVYRLLSDEEAARQGVPSWACGMNLGGAVRIRESCTRDFPEAWLLEHEFLHAILRCSQDGVYYANEHHIGPWWDGLRVGDRIDGHTH